MRYNFLSLSPLICDKHVQEHTEKLWKIHYQPLCKQVFFKLMHFLQAYYQKILYSRQPSLIRELTKVLATASKEMIPLSGGFPNPATFPFTKITVETVDGHSFCLENSHLQTALQYLPTQGYGPLVQWLNKLQDQMHNPPVDTSLVITNGSQDGLCKALEMLLEPGDSVVVEEFVYSGTLSIMNPYKPNYLTIKSDEGGMRPDSLRQVLNSLGKDVKRPKFLYINPTGANPTGTILSEERRKEIYELASEHDLLILEDDPYYFLQFTGKRPSSFLSIDVEGRVLRFDSFSKVLSSGVRLGFVTGPQPLVDRIVLHMQVIRIH